MAATLDQQQTTSGEFLSIGASADHYWAQQITIAKSGVLPKVALFLRDSGSPTGNMSVTIYSDNGSDNPNVAISNSAVLDTSILTTTLTWYEFAFSTQPTITTNDKIWIVVNYEAGNTVLWGASAGTYAGGILKYGASVGSLVTYGTYDSCFKQYYDVAATGSNFRLLLNVG